MKKTLLLVCFLLSLGLVHAQTKIAGTVTEQDGKTPMPFVTVSVKGQTGGVITTDVNGKYSINVNASAKTLVFSFMGMKTEEVAINGRTIVDVTLTADSEVLDEAVVTAEFGIKRPARAMGAAVQSVKGSDIAESGRENFVNALQGRVAGVQISSTSGAPGSSTSVIIRGATSLSGNNQPLFVIDGMPMNNTTYDPTSNLARNTPQSDPTVTTRQMDFANRGSDINPEDIESMTVLKGAAAAALYGSNASNGAIIITTKKGRSGRAKVSYSSSFRFDQAYRYPEIQTKYNNGSYGITNYYNQAHYGAPYQASDVLYDNLGNLFQTGVSQRHNLSMEAGNETMTVRSAVSLLDQTGVVPTSSYKRLNFSLGGTAKLNKWLNMEASMQYANTETKTTAKGSGGILQRTLAWPLTDDMRVYLTEDGEHLRRPNNYTDWDLLNPYFDLYKNINRNDNDRFISNLSVNITPIENMFIRGQVGLDISTGEYEIGRHPEWSGTNNGTGSYDLSKFNTSDPSINILTGYRKEVGAFNFSVQAGYHQLENGSKNLAVHGEKFMVRDFYSIQNCDQTTFRSATNTRKRRLQAISGQLEFSYKNLAFLTIRGRNDWSSTLPVENRSYFYPAADASIVLSDIGFMKPISNTVSYLKLRASIAKVGKDAPPLSIYPSLEASATTEGGYRYGYTGPNVTLKPEMSMAWEAGLEARLFKNRMDIDFAYYHTNITDQIVTGVRMSYATGYVTNTLNMGESYTEGVELRIAGDIVKTRDWMFNIGLNLNRNWSKVVSLPESLSEYYDAYTWVAGNIRNGTQAGQPITSISALDYQRNSKGQILIDQSSGLPLIEATNWTTVADREPKLIYGITGSLRWKNLTFSTLLDGRLGATVVNGTMRYMMSSGLSWESVAMREQGAIIFDGVLNDGLQNTDVPTKNMIAVNTSSVSSWPSAANMPWIERDVMYLRIAELRLAYNFPSKWLEKATKKLVSAASVFVAASDLYVFTNYSGIDVVGNSNSAAMGGSGGIGFDMMGIANPRGFAFGINLTF